MPHIVVKLWPGRNEEIKANLIFLKFGESFYKRNVVAYEIVDNTKIDGLKELKDSDVEVTYIENENTHIVKTTITKEYFYEERKNPFVTETEEVYNLYLNEEQMVKVNKTN